MANYRTVQKASTGLYKEKGSKFLAFCYPVENEEDISKCLSALRKEYYDARHHCYAWILGAEKQKYRANDDGEPNHSAGDPILGQLRSKDLTNALIVVVRYFGGVKLGVGGLKGAYKSAAEDAINNSNIVEYEIKAALRIHFPYESTSEIMRLVKEFDLKILDQSFNDSCYLLLEIVESRLNEAFDRFVLLQKLGIRLTVEK